MNYIFCAFVGYLIIVTKVSGKTRVVGGEVAPLEYGKYHASIQNLTGYHVCGGAVVSVRFVVTAAHCVYGADPDYMKIVSGTNNLSSGGKKYNVAKVLVYEFYNTESRENDIALIQIKGCFDLCYIQILPLRTEELVEGDGVILTGFGAKEPNGISTCTMQYLDLTVFNQAICEYAMRYASRPVTQEMFCTFSTIGEGTCHGDSGSPLVKDGKLVGIVSWGIPCAVGFPDVHTRISPYIYWIQNHIKVQKKKVVELPVKNTYNIFHKLKNMTKHMVDVPKGLKALLEKEI